MKEIYTALITPFEQDGSIDYRGLSNIIDHLIKQGNDRFVVCGTTGEVSTLRMHEKKQLIRYIRYHYPDIHLVVGVSSNSTNEIVRQIENFSSISSIDAFMIVVPYYNKPSQEGIYKHYDIIAASTNRNIMIYNVPSRTASAIEPETVIRLLKKHKNIIGLKEAGEIANIEIIKEQYPDFKVYVGNDHLLLEALNLGADGIISVVSHLDYPLLVDVCKHANIISDEYVKVLSKYIFKESSPAPLKYILHRLGYIENKLRLPLVSVSTTLEEQLDCIVEKYQ